MTQSNCLIRHSSRDERSEHLTRELYHSPHRDTSGRLEDTSTVSQYSNVSSLPAPTERGVQPQSCSCVSRWESSTQREAAEIKAHPSMPIFFLLRGQETPDRFTQSDAPTQVHSPLERDGSDTGLETVVHTHRSFCILHIDFNKKSYR